MLTHISIVRPFACPLTRTRSPCVTSKKRVRQDEEEVKRRIRELCGQHPTNGYRRITVWIRKTIKRAINRKRVYRLMKEMELLVRTQCHNAKRKKEKGKIPVERSNQHFQVDMTKIWCGQDGWGYLFAVIDAYDREIVGYKFSRFCRTDELLAAVEMALETRFPDGVKGKGLTIRSDNGCQMTSRRYQKALKDAGIKQERTGYNNPDADAYIERWFRTLRRSCLVAGVHFFP